MIGEFARGSQKDVKNEFYACALPSGHISYFCLEPKSPSLVAELGGASLPDGCLIEPFQLQGRYRRMTPFNGLYFAQMVGRALPVPDEYIMRDRILLPVLEDRVLGSQPVERAHPPRGAAGALGRTPLLHDGWRRGPLRAHGGRA